MDAHTRDEASGGIVDRVAAAFSRSASDVATNRVSVLKGDSVTLHTNITINQRDRVKWYFHDTLIAQINGDLRYICTDVQCNKDNEHFRDRLKLDNRTGDLTITNISTSDAEIYQLKIFSSSGRTGNGFDVFVHDAPAKNKEKSLMEGESVTLDTLEERNPNDLLTWYFNRTCIAEITGDQTKICEDVQCKQRFKNRLKLHHQSGSLIITNTKTTDSGLYKLQIETNKNLYRITSIMSFSVFVTDLGLSLAVTAVIYAAVFLLVTATAVGMIYYLRRPRKDEEGLQDRRGSQQDQCEDTDALFPFK
ncbi:Neural cell adhesion molecule L1 [Labeo rohita]|uniref:Neural cell adhesion molecule L1 n=1 Tax=Labeo rohita TaxID=84645 RepID=A0ABQ8LJC9_LABRO|nr:Neural cell adhesion molecule L1 [Labeo rohita]